MPKLYYYHGGLVKQHSKKNLIKTVRSKSTCLKWHFGQVGHGGKKTIWGVFWTKIPSKKSQDFFIVKCPCPMANTFMQPWEAINIVAQSFCQWFNPFGSNK
jgi:hypothetical protein